MGDTKMIVSDALLKQLSTETQKVGQLVHLSETRLMPEFMAFVSNVIILPHSEFYRNKFMHFYELYNQNSVKALKELAVDFPYTPDYQLGLGFVIHIQLKVSEIPGQVKILLAHEFDFIQNKSLSDFRQKIYSGNSSVSNPLPE